MRKHAALPTTIAAFLMAATFAGAVELPQDHEYQRVLRDYMAKLGEKDFDHGITNETPFTVVAPRDTEKAYRDYMLSLSLLPIIGSKRGYPCVSSPPRLFLLSTIEGGDAVLKPPVWPEPLAWLARWDYEGNPFKDMRAIKLRAFVDVCVEMIMTDHQIETEPEKGGNRPDWFAPHLIMLAYPYATVRDVLPDKVKKAYETGLRKMVRRQLDWGVKREEINMDMIAVVGLWYASECLKDSDLTGEIKAYTRGLVAEPGSFHPAGYFVDQGGIEVGFGGMAAYLASWFALAGGWDFAEENIRKYFMLRAHLSLPDPDGTMNGPSHFNTRLDTDAWGDQWDFGFRHYAAAMITDEAAHLVNIPTPEQIAEGHNKMVGWFNHCVSETPLAKNESGEWRNLTPEQLGAHAWQFRLWPSWDYPMNVCFAYDHYRDGSYAKLLKLQKENSPWLRSPYLRGETFIRAFDEAFTIARMPGFAAIIHTGAVGADTPDSGVFHYVGAYGFGGGQLSAFWTPAAGSIILGRRAGMNFDKTMDLLEDWKLWPLHAVTGCKGDGKVFTSARIARPKTEREIKGDTARVSVAGRIPPEMLKQGKALECALPYQREFVVTPEGVSVTTVVRAYGQDTIAELYETLPFFFCDAKRRREEIAVNIEFKIGKEWTPATAEFKDGVTAARATRLDGAVEIVFDRPRRVALSPKEWKTNYITATVCRNLMVDLLENEGKPLALNGEKRVSWSIKPVAKP